MIAFSPVRQHPEVLNLFLKHMAAQPVELWVYDDNEDGISSAMLDACEVLPEIPGLEDTRYLRREDTHLWDVAGYSRVAKIKNAAIDRFLQTDSDALFLIDSDVLLQPGTIEHLDEAKLPIIASTYWTKWSPHHGRGPNMWGSPPEPLLEPGHHEVHGLGACTLIRREVFEAKVRFDVPEDKPKLGAEGEDRWFCHLAREAGFPLIMCSHMNPFHVYRDSEIQAGREWSKSVLP